MPADQPRQLLFRVRPIEMAGFFGFGTLGLAAFYWMWFGPGNWRTDPPSSAFTLGIFYLSPLLIPAGSYFIAKAAALAFGGPFRVSDEGFYNPSMFRPSLRRLTWDQVAEAWVRRVGSGRLLYLRLSDGRRSIVPLKIIRNADDLVDEVRKRAPEWANGS